MAGLINSQIGNIALPGNARVEAEVCSRAGTVFASARAMFFKNVGAVNGTVEGVPLTPGEVLNLPYCDRIYGDVAYDSSATSFKIIVVR